ncbi:unnamed protein product [Onchocerca ochengi]|uniref:PAS domain-containing protein n=1 Tax=Onchocerca ochengi TaxID=42157 RepID=A0A182EL48_ONCOC|nr:unnamed protein product [Onchocerca ochengi]
MEGINLDGFIYDCSPNSIRTIYCSLIGEVCIDERTEIINRNRKLNVGMWCRFKAYRKKTGEWFAQKILLMAYPRLKCVIKEDKCIVKGTAVVCNISRDGGYLWNDYIGLIAIEGQMINQLKSLTAVEFQAVPFRKNGTSAYFIGKEINVESESIFQSEVLIFIRNAEIKEDGRAHVSGCTITLLDIACSTPPVIGTTMSIIYYKAYNDNTSGIGIYATTDSSIVAGIRDDFFTTKRYFETDAEDAEVERFDDAREDLSMLSNQSQVMDDEIFGLQIDMSESPIESFVEFSATDENIDSSKVVSPLANDNNRSMNQIPELCSSLNSFILDSELNSGDKFPSSSFAKKEMIDEMIMICDPELASSSTDIPAESKKEFMKLDKVGQIRIDPNLMNYLFLIR